MRGPQLPEGLTPKSGALSVRDAAEIAERMYVSPVTVRTHVAAILRKLNVTSREEVLALLDAS